MISEFTCAKHFLILLFFLFSSSTIYAQEWYKMPKGVKTRWVSFENIKAEKGVGGTENKGAKGHAYDQVNAGETVTLLNVKGAGIVNRIWMTMNDRDPEMLRSLRIDMYWDGAIKPAVSAPLGDFFGVGLGQRIQFESALFSDPEGRSFNCKIPMPFRTGAHITVTNESDQDLLLLFYDINFVKVEKHDKDILYFHTFWNRDMNAALGKDYVILPQVSGTGRFLGTNLGVITDPIYENSWWGEGEVKIYLDGDEKYPTLVGTGTEDYVGTAWGQGTFDHKYQGSLIVDKEAGRYAFYRYHIPDPVYFQKDIKVTIHQMGGAMKEEVIKFIENGAKLLPVTGGEVPNMVKLLELNPVPDIHDPEFPEGWTNFYRVDDWSSTAYFYLNKPTNNLQGLPAVEQRIQNLKDNNKN